MTKGPIAQLGERSVRIREVEGSNPFRSTNFMAVACSRTRQPTFIFGGYGYDENHKTKSC